MLRDVDDEDTVFDKQNLLDSDPVDPDIEFSGGQKSDWCSRFIKTIVLSIAFFALGLCIAMPGPTLLDLGERVQKDTEHMSMIFVARSIGYLLGSIIGGFLFDHFDQQILMFYTLILTAIATVVAPWCTVLIVLAVMIAFQGLSMGILDTGGNVFCINIWKHKSGPYMQGMHFAFGIGAFIAPLLARPFLNLPTELIQANNSLLSFPHSITPIVPSIPDYALMPHSSENYKEHLLVRRNSDEQENSTSNAMDDITVANLNVSNSSVSDVNITTSTMTSVITKKPAKPDFVDGGIMKKEYSDGDKIKDAIKDSVKKKVMGDKKTDAEKNDNEKPVSSTAAVNVSTNNGTQTTFSPGNSSSTEGNDVNNTTVTISTSTSMTQASKTTLQLQTTTAPTTTPTTQATTTPTTQETTSTTRATTSTSQQQTTQRETLSTQERTSTKQSNLLSTAPTVNKTTNTSAVNETDHNLNNTETERPKKPETFGDFVHKTLNAVVHMSRIQFAYAIIGVLLIVNAFMFLVLYCKDKQRSPAERRRERERHHYGNESTGFCVTMLFLLFFFFFAYVGMEVTFGGLLSTFVVEYLKWSKRQGATATALFWGSLAAGRGISIFLAKCFKPPCMLVSNTVLVVIGALILSFGIQVNDVALWVGTVTIGFGMSSIFPTGISWADHYFPLTGKATAVFVVGSALGEMTIPVVTGYLYTNKDKMYLMYTMVAVGIFCSVLYIIMQCVASHNQKTSAASKKGFLRLDEDESVPMDSLSSSYGTSDYAEVIRKRPAKNTNGVDKQPEYDRLIDIDD